MSDKKNIKNKNLLNFILQNIINVEPNNNTDDNNIDKILLVKYRDAIDIDISSFISNSSKRYFLKEFLSFLKI